MSNPGTWTASSNFQTTRDVCSEPDVYTPLDSCLGHDPAAVIDGLISKTGVLGTGFYTEMNSGGPGRWELHLGTIRGIVGVVVDLALGTHYRSATVTVS